MKSRPDEELDREESSRQETNNRVLPRITNRRIANLLWKIVIAAATLSLATPALTTQTFQINYTTASKIQNLPTRASYAGMNMDIFNSATSNNDSAMQSFAKTPDLGWVRFPGGTSDDSSDWQTGQAPATSVNEFDNNSPGTPINTANAGTYPFGYMKPAGLAMEIIDEPINTSAGLWPTTVTNSTTFPYTSSYGGTVNSMPSTYAQAFKYADGPHSMLITNKDQTHNQTVEILQNGVQVTSTFTTRSIGGVGLQGTTTTLSAPAITISTQPSTREPIRFRPMASWM